MRRGRPPGPRQSAPSPRRQAWFALGGLAAAATWGSCAAAGRLPASPTSTTASDPPHAWVRFLAPTLLANALDGMGYVGYSTFIIALQRQQGCGNQAPAVFLGVLGIARMVAGGWCGAAG